MRKRVDVGGLVEVKTYLKLFLYLVLFNTMFILVTMVLHEAGHFFVGTYVMGCEGSIILYDKSQPGPYTQLNCTDAPNNYAIYLSSLTFMVPFALLFLLLRGFEEKHFFLVILGVSIITMGFDTEAITNSEAARFLTMMAGMLVFIAGEYVVIDDMFKRFKDRIHQIHSERTGAY